MTRILLIGHGRMGRLVERLAPEHGCAIAGVVTDEPGSPAIKRSRRRWRSTCTIDFTQPDAVAANFTVLAERRLNVVIGTTGWQTHEFAMREVAASAGIGVLAAANFSVGMNVFRLVVEEAAAL